MKGKGWMDGDFFGMSGVCGFLDFSGAYSLPEMDSCVERMHAALFAPSDGFVFAEEGCVIGRNDCYAVSDTFVCFFHGELYNGRTLSKEAKNEAEIVLEGFSAVGSAFFSKLCGKFVIVLYDRLQHTLRLVRDRIGSKPLFFYQTNRFFLFSTELNSLLASSLVPKEIDREALSQYLQLTYLPAPKCILKNVQKLQPALEFFVDRAGSVQKTPYWELTPATDAAYSEFDVCKSKLESLLSDSVREKMDLYQSRGAFLSGGFDSSIVVTVMAALSDQPVKTFTVGYDQKQYDESELALLVAKKNQTDHTVLKLDWDAVVSKLDTLLNGMDEPYADSSLIATYAVCKVAKEHVDVAFMGDGGDELFAGYNKYLISYYGQKYQKFPRWFRKGIFEPLVRLLPAKHGLRRKIDKVIGASKLSPFEQRKRMMSLGFKPEELQTLLTDGFADPLSFLEEQYLAPKDVDEQTRAQYVDFKTVLEGDMLPKVETASKLSGLITCAPLLDERIVDFAFRIPTAYKINGKERKIILKETYRDRLPEELFSAPKHGFAVPVGYWLENELKEQLLSYSDESFLKAQGLFRYEAVQQILNEHFTHQKDRYSELWAYFVFQHWYQNTFSVSNGGRR